jgi:hypothetical protein
MGQCQLTNKVGRVDGFLRAKLEPAPLKGLSCLCELVQQRTWLVKMPVEAWAYDNQGGFALNGLV